MAAPQADGLHFNFDVPSRRSGFVEDNMRGVITGRDVLANCGLIWREFGLTCLLRCLYASVSGKQCTFLEMAVKPEQR